MKLVHSALLLAVLPLALGCGSDGSAQTKEPPAEVEPREKQAASDAMDVSGRWMLWLIEAPNEIPMAMLEVDDAGKTKVLESDRFEVGSAEVSPESFRVEATDEEDDTFVFTGTARGSEFRGTAVIEGAPRVWLARLVRTDLPSLELVEGRRVTGMSEFVDAVRSGRDSEIEEFLENRRSNPLAMQAAETLLAKAADEDEQKVRDRAKQYVELAGEWGPENAVYARLRIPLLLVDSVDPKIVRSFTEEATAKFEETETERWKPLLDAIGERLHRAEAMADVASEDEEKAAAALESLVTIHEEDPTETEVTYLLAEVAEKRGDKERALELYGELLALPSLELQFWRTLSNRGEEPELPSERFDRLWGELRGKDADRTAYLDELYEKRAFYFADEKAAARTESEGTRVALVELFTGAMCPPCVAADVALGAAEKVYGHDRLVAIRYHQHIPGADPFANSDGESRFDYYNPQGTPWVMVDGRQVNAIGSYGSSERSYDELLEAIRTDIAEPTEVEIAIEAEAMEDRLRIKATATGLDEAGEATRLRVVLAEDLVHFPARNGVRLHEMVVRDMVGGVNGVGVESGTATLEETLDLPALKKGLLADLAGYEEARNANIPEKPMPFESFHVVAFVQDDQTRKVLQAKAIPVKGKLVFDAEGPTLEAPASKPEDSEPEESSDGGTKPAEDTDE